MILAVTVGGWKCDVALAVDSNISRRSVSAVSVGNDDTSESTLLWCEEFRKPAITWDFIMSSEYDTVQRASAQSHRRLKSQSIAWDLRREMKQVMVSPSLCHIVKNC